MHTYSSMGWAHNIIFMLVIICMEKTCMEASYNISTDEYALLAIKNHITSDPNNALSTNWTRGTSVCNWRGVTCGTRHSRVTSIRLISTGLTGTIAKEIGNLSFLAFLDIANNSFQGEIPQEIGYLRRLNHLSLQYNQLVGQIPPSFNSLDRLQLLDLSNNNLIGTIPISIFNISSLRTIDLGSNQLQGTLPIDICNNLPMLQDISLSGNQLGGEIPSLEKCTQAIYISLSRNMFTGDVSKQIGNLTVLQELYLGWNNLTGSLPELVENNRSLRLLKRINLRQNELVGVIPSSLGNFSNLEMLDLGRNNFEGYIPTELGHLSTLQELYLSFCNLNGHIPMSIYNLTNLQILALNRNNLSGVIPAIVLPNLQQIYLGRNQFTGQIPISISNGSSLRIIDLSYNSLSGFIPMTIGNLVHLNTIVLEGNQLTNDPINLELQFLTSLANCPNLRTIQIGYNPFNGALPKSLSSNISSSLEIFHASGCGLKGSIPIVIGNMSRLIWLSLARNNLTGEIPHTVGHLRNLQRLRVFNNEIRGEIPSTLCDLEELYELDFSTNELSGAFPSCLGNVSSLRLIYLNSNALTSSLESSFWNNKGMLIVNLSSNFLNGTLSREIGSITGLTQLYLDGNNFSGEIPTTFGELQDLAILSLSMNMLYGSLPQEFGNMAGLEYLDLSHNRISGTIPMSMERLIHLAYLNLSFNDLSGEIPNGGPFVNFSSESFIGNHALCGASRFSVNPCTTIDSKRPRMNRTLIYVLPICALVVLVIIGLVIWMLKFRKKVKMVRPEIDIERAHRFSYLEIVNATNNFDTINLVGRGSFGSVYKATFSNGIVAAIKVFDLEVREAFKSFDTECEAMRGIRHRNLVKVISACSNEEFKAIIFEYMPNGSLEDWLYSQDNCLDIGQRLGIMIDVASALEYLHHGYSYPMVHCDLKPNNVLFDEDMIAHLGDFGIAKLLEGDKSMIQTKTLGTMGYMAPEYGSEGIVSTMADVYSFGILMMEICTGKKPTDDKFTENLSLNLWVSELLSDDQNMMEIISTDAKLLTNIMVDEEKLDIISSCFKALITLALECTDDIRENRIDMKNVLARLNKIQIQFHHDIMTTTS